MRSSVLKFLCKWFNHSFSQVDLIMAEIKSNKFNRGRVPNVLTCRRCRWTLDLNDMEAIDTYLQHRKKRNAVTKNKSE